MALKSDRLKKLESELKDLEEWKRLGLVPKKDQKKHDEEIISLQEKIEEEHQRLEHLKENGEAEEYVSPKKSISRQAGYINMPTLPDVDIEDGASSNNTSSLTDINTEAETASDFDQNTTVAETTASEATSSDTEYTESDEDPFSDANRWRRGIADPDDEDNW